MIIAARALRSGQVIVDGTDRHTVIGVYFDPSAFMGGYEGTKAAMRIVLEERALFPVYPAHQFEVV